MNQFVSKDGATKTVKYDIADKEFKEIIKEHGKCIRIDIPGLFGPADYSKEIREVRTATAR